MESGFNSATDDERADNKEFTLYLTMSVRCAAQIWQKQGDADLAMRVLTRAIYSPHEMPEIDPAALVVNSQQIGEWVAEHPLDDCNICGSFGIATIDGQALCWSHYDATIWHQFSKDLKPKLAGMTDGDDSS